MNNPNKVIGALLVSALTMSSTLPSQYTNATNESDETASNMQQARDTAAAGLQCVVDTARTYPGTTVATLTGTAALAGGVCAYYNGYVPSNLGDLIKSGYEVAKDTLKSDLTIGELVQDSSICSAWSQNNFFRKLLKAGRISGCRFLANICLSLLFPSSPNAKQHSMEPSWLTVVIMAPILEELLYTGAGSLLFKDYAQIVVPLLFTADHILGPSAALQDRNMKIRLLLNTWICNFVHHRVVRKNLRSEFPVVIMSHMIHNQLALAFNALQKKRMENSAL